METCGLGAECARTEAVLGAGPNFERAVVIVERSGVYWLHGCVGEIGHIVEPLDDAAVFQRVGADAGDEILLDFAILQRGEVKVTDRLRGDIPVAGIVKDRLQHSDGIAGAPETIGDYYDCIVQPYNFLDTAIVGDWFFVQGNEFAAKHRGYSDRGVQHVGQFGVDAIVPGAVNLGRNIDAGNRLADERVFAFRFQFWMRRRAVVRSRGSQVSIAEALARRHVDHAAHLGA